MTKKSSMEQLADLRTYFKEQGIKPKETMWAIRAAVTGRTHGADMVGNTAFARQRQSCTQNKKSCIKCVYI